MIVQQRLARGPLVRDWTLWSHSNNSPRLRTKGIQLAKFSPRAEEWARQPPFYHFPREKCDNVANTREILLRIYACGRWAWLGPIALPCIPVRIYKTSLNSGNGWDWKRIASRPPNQALLPRYETKLQENTDAKCIPPARSCTSLRGRPWCGCRWEHAVIAAEYASPSSTMPSRDQPRPRQLFQKCAWSYPGRRRLLRQRSWSRDHTLLPRDEDSRASNVSSPRDHKGLSYPALSQTQASPQLSLLNLQPKYPCLETGRWTKSWRLEAKLQQLSDEGMVFWPNLRSRPVFFSYAKQVNSLDRFGDYTDLL